MTFRTIIVLKGQFEIFALASLALPLGGGNVRQPRAFGGNRAIVIDKFFVQRIIPFAAGQYQRKKT